MNDLQIFSSPEFGEIRTVSIDGEPWFVGKDVAAALGYSNTKDAIGRHVDREDKGGSRFPTPSGEQEMTIINESGLYSLVLGSHLDGARKFRRWITSEVIPTIRRHGAYMTPDTIERVLTDPDTIIRLATELKTEREKRAALEAQAERDRPKVRTTVFYPAVLRARRSVKGGGRWTRSLSSRSRRTRAPARSISRAATTARQICSC